MAATSRSLLLGRRLCAVGAGGRRRWCSAATAAVVEPPAVHEEASLKPYESIPSARGLPFLGTTLSILAHGGAPKLHEYVDMRHRQLGPMFRERLGPVEAVCVAEQRLIWDVYMHEGAHPRHLVPEPWLIYNRTRGIQRGLFFMDGEEWQEKRLLLNKSLLSRNVFCKYGSDISGIVEDLIQRWDLLAREHGGIVPHLETELYNWSIETLGTIVFGRRLGCVSATGSESLEMRTFVSNVQKIFSESARMSLLSPQLAAKYRLPVWRRFEQAADNALTIARNCTEQRIEELRGVSDLEEHGVIGHLLTKSSVTLNEIVNIVADLIIAAADTTSHATQWALYSLAKNPECQQKLFRQIEEVVPKGETVSEHHVDDIPYLMWVVKETLRLYPIAPFLTRLFDREIDVGGYAIPPETVVLMSQYTIGRNPELFRRAEEFVPERWERKPRTATNSSHENIGKGCMPFGSGKRSCIGRRVAELKMRVLIARAVQRYRLEAENEVGIALRMITTPDKPIQLSLHERRP